jgi:sugar transferase (PEP-CTERM system associated)
MLPLLKHSFTKRIFNTLALEVLALIGFFGLAIIFIGGKSISHFIDEVQVPLFAIASTAMVQISLWSFGLYSREVIYSGNRVFSNLVNSFLLSGFLLLPVCFSVSFSTQNPLLLYSLSLVSLISLITVERALVLRIFNQSPYLGSILILGTGEATRELIAEARRNHGKTFHLLGILTVNPDEVGTCIEGCKVIGRFDEIQEIVAGCDVKCILISIPVYSTALPTDFLLKCKLRGILVHDSLEFYETLGKKILLEKLDPVQLLLSENLLMTRFRWLLKGSSEKLIAVVLLFLGLPVMVLSVLLIRITSKGPVFYKQERIGKDGRVFNLLKFRSMIDGAEKNGPVWAQIDDPRITSIGRILRLFRIDELPQLFNVLRGEMAIVGPRPERPRFVEKLSSEIEFYGHRHLVHPGITGWAQVAYPYGATVEDAREKLRYDLYYIKNMSFFFDLMIVISTIRTVIFARGSR